MTPTQGEHAQTEALKHAEGLEWFAERAPGFGLDPLPLKNTAAFIRRLHAQVAALTPAPKCLTCNDHGAVGNILTAEPCPDCTPAQPAALAHELFAAAQLAPGEGIEDAVSRIVAALTASPHPPRVSPEMVDSLERAADTLERLKALGSRVKHLDDTTAQPAAPQGVAYAELPDDFPKTVAELEFLLDVARNCGQHMERADRLAASNGQAPASRITVEQVEDAIGLQSTAWDTIGAEKIVEAVLRLANGQAPAGATLPEPEMHPVFPGGTPWPHYPNLQIGQRVRVHTGEEGVIESLRNNTKKYQVLLRPGYGGQYGSWEVTPIAPTAQAAPAAADFTTLGAALRAIQQAIDLIGEPADDRMRTVKRVLRGAVIVAEDSGELSAPAAGAVAGPVVRVGNQEFGLTDTGKHFTAQDMAFAAGQAFDEGLSAAPTPAAPTDSVLEDAAFEAVRKKLCALPRYSFVLDDDGLVRRVLDRSGNWIEFDEAHALFDPISVDAARKQGGTHDNH